jgi:LysM repeat protein
MNNPSPLFPQGSNLELHARRRSSLKVKIFCALGVNVVVLLVFLMQGCKREQPQPTQVEQFPFYADTNPPPEQPVDPALTLPPPTEPVVDPATAYATSGVPASVTAPPPVELSPQEYTIQAGDTFTSIGKRFNVSISAIQAANPGVDATRLQIGRKLVIPAPVAAAATAGAEPLAAGEVVHVVKSGDTLSKLAADYKTTVQAIQSANGLSDSRIKVGQKLKIPRNGQ